MRVLIIEDDADIAASLRSMLTRLHYAVDVAADGDDGLDRLLGGAYDLALVDVVLPKRDGFSICSAARAEKLATPLLLLTARDAVEDRIRGLDAGADDYLSKPFNEGELMARMRALLRRGERPAMPEQYAIGNLIVDPAARTVSIGEAGLDLGSTEFRMLELFARNRGMTLSRTQIMEKIWDYDFQGSSNIVDVYVSQLRRKLAKLRSTATIETVWGVGYKLGEAPSKAERSSA